MLADMITPVSMYLKLRDRFANSILLESSDYHSPENASSFIGLEPIASIYIDNNDLVEEIDGKRKITSLESQKKGFVAESVHNFTKQFDLLEKKDINKANAIFGYTSYDAVQYFEDVEFNPNKKKSDIPLLKYVLYRYIIEYNHFNNTLSLIELLRDGQESQIDTVKDILLNTSLPEFKFSLDANEETNMSDQQYCDMINNAKQNCSRGDVFQIVLSRQFKQKYKGDDFNLYRSLRSVNPSPYLFYFDYGSYRIMGSSPLAEKLQNDEKEQSEHVMLVDLARNDLSRDATDIKLEVFREVQYFSHVIHLVSKVSGCLRENYNSYSLVANTFPAGTLSGAPKHKALQLIEDYEPTPRGFYGGCIGSIGFNGELNQAIMIRTFMSKDNTLYFQAGAGVVEKSIAENELAEVSNKLAALRKALELAQKI